MSISSRFASIFSFLVELDNNDKIGYAFFLILIVLSSVAWYLICIKNRADRWSSAIRAHHERLGVPFFGKRIFFKPTALKIAATIYLVCLVLGFILVLASRGA